MSQLIKATITPYEAVHFRQSARLVSSGSLDTERRRIMAMQARFQMRYSGQGVASKPHDTSQVRRAFMPKRQAQQISQDSPAAETVVSTPVQPEISASDTRNLTLSTPIAASQFSTKSGSASEGNAYIEQAQAAHSMEKASFELRVASGELSYVPAFDFTIVLQRPGVQFEYMGDFTYVPPSWSPIGENIDMLL